MIVSYQHAHSAIDQRHDKQSHDHDLCNTNGTSDCVGAIAFKAGTF